MTTFEIIDGLPSEVLLVHGSGTTSTGQYRTIELLGRIIIELVRHTDYEVISPLEVRRKQE